VDSNPQATANTQVNHPLTQQPQQSQIGTQRVHAHVTLGSGMQPGMQRIKLYSLSRP